MDADDAGLVAVAEAIADRVAVDWSSVHASVQRPPDLRELQIIAAVAEVHRQAGAPPSGASFGDVLATVSVAPPVSTATGGTPWGPLIVLDRVGSGSFGTVYRARDPTLDHEVALKRVRLSADSPRSQAASIVREGQLLARVRHENVITVHGALEINGEVGIWMDFVHGRTLAQIIRHDGPMSAQEAAVVGESLCRALAAVHQAGLIHRDIKAANVMREERGRIVMLDFGAGTEASAEFPGASRVAGTPLYMAPELFEGQAASVRSDLYSLGVLLFYLVTGEYPVWGHSFAQIRDAHTARSPRSLSDLRPDLPEQFLRTVDRALCPAPNDRFPSAGAMLRELRGADHPQTSGAASPAIRIAALSIAGASFGAMMLGAISSGAFNLVLERGPFATDTPWDWLIIGVRSTLVAVILFTFGSIAIALLWLIRQILVKVSTPAARLDRALITRCKAAAASVGLNDTSTLASWLVGISASVLLGAVWFFQPMFDAITSNVSTGPLELFTVFSPARADYQLRYRSVFEWLVIGTGAAWYAVHRLAARRQQHLNAGLIVAGAATMFLALVALDLPYRLIFHSEFRVAEWKGHRCYITGEDADNVQLFCPALEIPRSRVLLKQSGEVRQLDTVESIFSHGSPPIVTRSP